MGICDCERFLKVSGRGVLEVSQRKGQGARSITPVRSQRAGDKPRPAAIWLAAGGTRGRPPLSPETDYGPRNRAEIGRVRCRSVYSSNVYRSRFHSVRSPWGRPRRCGRLEPTATPFRTPYIPGGDSRRSPGRRICCSVVTARSACSGRESLCVYCQHVHYLALTLSSGRNHIPNTPPDA